MEDAAFFDYVLIAVALVVSLRWYHATILRNGSGDDPATTAGALEPRHVDYVPKTPEPTTATPLGRVLSRICLVGRYRSIDDVIEGARLAYEQVLNAFAAGDLRAETSLLSRTVREAFEAAIVERRSQGHVSEFTFIGLKAADIVDAGDDSTTICSRSGVRNARQGGPYRCRSSRAGGRTGRVVDVRARSRLGGPELDAGRHEGR